VADQRLIPTPSDERYKVLARLRVRATRRRHRRYVALRAATRAMELLTGLLYRSTEDVRVDAGTLLMRDLRNIVATLIPRLNELQEEEDSDRSREWEIWRGTN
jgi:hypothetical protein